MYKCACTVVCVCVCVCVYVRVYKGVKTYLNSLIHSFTGKNI